MVESASTKSRAVNSRSYEAPEVPVVLLTSYSRRETQGGRMPGPKRDAPVLRMAQGLLIDSLRLAVLWERNEVLAWRNDT